MINTGVRLGVQDFGAFAYANDVTLISATVPGLQRRSVGTQYADEWRMLFNPAKFKCMTMGRNEFVVEPSWYLKGSLVENVSEMDLLGVTFQCNGTSTAHVDNRISNCRRSFYGLSSRGMCYPGILYLENCVQSCFNIWIRMCIS